LILHIKGDYDSFLEMMFKTEFLLLLNKKYRAQLGRDITVKFSNRWGVFCIIFRSAHLCYIMHTFTNLLCLCFFVFLC